MKQVHLFAALAALLTLTACSNEEEALSSSSNFPADGVIRIAATVEEPATTRGGMTADKIRDFNLKIVNEANDKYSYYAYCLKSDKPDKPDEWIYYKEDKSTLQTLLWQNNTQPVIVTALSQAGGNWSEKAFNENTQFGVLPDQTVTSGLEQSDLLYMEPKVIDPASDLTDGKLPITFNHLFSKVNLTVELGTEFNITTTNPISDLKVNGTITATNWNPSDKNSAFTPIGTPAPVTPLAGAYTAGDADASYECILIPQEVAANGFSVTFTLNDKNYTWTSAAAVTLERGIAYDLVLTVSTVTTKARSATSAAADGNATVVGILSTSQTWNK